MANSTGNFLQDIQSAANEMWGEPEINYPSAPQGLEDQINAMPNSEKLSGTERWLYQKLPGFSENSIVKAISSFASGPAGKILEKFDILAEGLERTMGLAAQLRDSKPGDDFRIKDAWEAGSLFYDTARIPRLQYGPDGNVTGIQVDTSLPGAYAVTEARKLLESGKTIDEIRDTMYSNLGALALRSQLQDALGHIALDPLNWALTAVKPIEKLHAIRHLALTGKMDVADVAKLEKTARLAGDIETADKMVEAMKVAESTGKAMTRMDKFAINLLGGTPWTQDVTKMTSKQQWLAKLNPFALTPQARAAELLDIVEANVGAYLIQPNWNKDPAEFIDMMSKIAKGGIGDQWGHLAMTTQGRTVQSLVSNADGAVRALGVEWKAYETERNLVRLVQETIPGFNAKQIRELASKNPDLIIKKLAEVAERPGFENLKQMLVDGKIVREQFEQIGKMDTKIPLTREEWYLKAKVTIEDMAVQQGILQFGITEKGALTKWADALKAWETIPFIKANPANMVRNVINNDVTLVARGLWGTMSQKAIGAFWDGKWMPNQMRRAFSFASEGEFDATIATQRLIKALEGEGDDLASKVKRAAGNFRLGPKIGEGDKAHDLLDFSKYSQDMEAAASIRASTNGWMEFHQKYWNSKTGFTSISKTLDPSVIDEMETAIPGITKLLDDVAASSGADADKFQKLMDMELDLNVNSVFQDAANDLGYKLDDVLGQEVTHILQEGLPDAMKRGNVREFVDSVKLQMEQHVDEMFNQHVENLPGIIAAQVQAGGPLQYHRIFGKAMDEFWGGNIEHSIRMSSVNELMDFASKSGDYKKVSQLWEKILTDGENHFGRVWKKFDAYQEGLKNGAKNAGMKYPEEVGQSFKDMQKGWKDLFNFRNSEYKKFFEAKLSGSDYKRTLEQIQAEIDNMYVKMTGEEDRLYQQIDDLMSGSMDDFSGNMYKNYRDQASELRLQDRQNTQDFFKAIRTASKEDAPKMWSKYWADRTKRLEQMRQLDMRGSAAIQGDEQAVSLFSKMADDGGEVTDIRTLANKYGIPSATKSGARNDRRILNTVNKYLPEGTEKFKSVDDIPMEIADQAFSARVTNKAGEIGQAAERAFIPDADKIFKDPMPMETAMSELNYGRSYAALESIVESASSRATQKSRLLKDLPEHLQNKVKNWVEKVNGESSGFRAGAVQYSAFRRDSALLNYNRRSNFDNWVGHMAPFAFWTTHSVANWAIHSLDRPAMLTSYFRTREFFETAGLADQNVPTRLKGNIRVNLPFTPDWMGDMFVDPLRTLLPIDAWLQPWEQAQTSKFQIEGKTKATLEQMLESGTITEEAYNEALRTKQGDVWERAKATAEEGGDAYNAMDFVQMTMTPHAPLLWAYNAATGNKSEIGPFTPATRTVKNFATMMGVDDWSNSPYNIEARIRKSMGLPAFDKWDDYRVGREISNIAADGNHSIEAVNEAMQVAAMVEAGKMTSDEAVKGNELYALATKRSNQEYAGGWTGTILGLLGIQVKAYPEGEQRQRELADMFSDAYAEYDNGNPEALAKFFDDHPEYEARLALFKSPEERLKTFMVDNVWSRWNELPKVTQDEMKEQLGPNFQNYFMNKETRSYDAVSPVQLQVWLKLMGGKPVGSLSASEEVMIELNQLKLTDPETAWRVETFYDMRNEFPNWSKLQNEYYSLPEESRGQFLKENAELKQYWDSRRDWMQKNPDLVRFLTDDPKQLKKYENQQRQAEFATPTADEIRQQISQPTAELLTDWMAGEQLPPSVQEYLNELAQGFGIDTRTMLGILTGR